VSRTEELLERKSSGSGLETEINTVGIRRADHATPLYPQKLTLTSPTKGGRSVGIVRSRTKARSLVFFIEQPCLVWCAILLSTPLVAVVVCSGICQCSVCYTHGY
jgi:hypothetical protein